MADGKRNSMAGKVATPKIGGQGISELDTALVKAIGARVKVTNGLGQIFEGTLYTACSMTNVIAINTTTPPPTPSSSVASQPGDYHIIPVIAIKAFEILSLPTEADRVEGSAPGFEGMLPSITKVDIEAARAREATAIRKIKELDATKGRGVSKEVQEAFDFLLKRLPTRWHETQIVVNDAVVISSPYRVEDCAAPKDQNQSLIQVKKVLGDFWSRRKSGQGEKGPQGGNTNNRVATPIAPRKGG